VSTRRRIVVVGVGAILMAAGLAASGCGGSSELKEANQFSKFFDDIVHGRLNEWKLADDAAPVAATAWRHRSTMERFQGFLDEHPDWACTIADNAAHGHDVFDELVPAPTQTQIEEWNSLVDALTNEEVSGLVSAACGL
jgi:hypothetical protein